MGSVMCQLADQSYLRNKILSGNTAYLEHKAGTSVPAFIIFRLFTVMIPAGCDQDPICLHCIDDPVFLIDPPAPPAGKAALERFRLSGTMKGISDHFFDQAVDLPQCLFIF